MSYTNDELKQLAFDAQVSNDERRKKYGVIGLKHTANPSVFVIPENEKGSRLLSVTLENSTIVKADAGRVLPVSGAKVTLRTENNRWIILGADDREALTTTNNTTINTTPHIHNIGAPSGLFYPIDPASVNDGMVLPTGNGLEVTIGRVTYPKSNGTTGIYDSSDTLDFSSAVTGLDATQSRWAIIYIDKSDGSVDYHISTAGTAPLNTISDLENAIADCLSNVDDAYPYHAVRIRAGLSVFSSYAMMSGRSLDSKDFIRLGTVSGGNGSTIASASDLTTRLEPLVLNGEILFLNGDVIMIEVDN